MVVPGGSAVSYERGTPAVSLFAGTGVCPPRDSTWLGLIAGTGFDLEGEYEATWKRGFKLSWRKAGLLKPS